MMAKKIVRRNSDPSIGATAKEIIDILKWVALGFIVLAVPGLINLFGGGSLSELILVVYILIAIPCFALIVVLVVVVKLFALYPILSMGDPDRRSPWNIWFWIFGGTYALLLALNAYANLQGDTSEQFQWLHTSSTMIYAPYISAFGLAALVVSYIRVVRPRDSKLYVALRTLVLCLMVLLI